MPAGSESTPRRQMQGRPSRLAAWTFYFCPLSRNQIATLADTFTAPVADWRGSIQAGQVPASLRPEAETELVANGFVDFEDVARLLGTI
jgi:hypothetical protein